MKVQVIKLKSGEEILTEVTYNDPHKEVRIKNPITIAGIRQDGSISVGPLSVFLKKDQEIKIQNKDIIFMGDPNSNAESEYIRATTGLEIAGKKGILSP